MSNEVMVMLIGFGSMILISAVMFYFFAKFLKRFMLKFKDVAADMTNQYNHWPRTQAIIEHTEILKEFSRSRGLVAGSGNWTYKPLIKYRYEVDNVEYKGSNLAIMLINNASRKDIGRFLLDYEVGKPLIIRYDPQNPEISVIFIKLTLPHDTDNRGPMFMKDLPKELQN